MFRSENRFCRVLDNVCNINLVSVSGEDVKLTIFHQKLCHACLKSGGVLYPLLQKVGARVPPVPLTFYAYDFNTKNSTRAFCGWILLEGTRCENLGLQHSWLI